ncbi:MAG: serine--tRNA ligase [Deltaproteobacteria bacterium]|nr:serine--tRNA ligase [Deltaproteobacteria bacterium]
MIDLELFRKNPQIFESEIKKRGLKINTSIGLKLDKVKRDLIFKIDRLRSEKNLASKIISGLKEEEKNKKIDQMKKINDDLKKMEAELAEVEDKFIIHFSTYPNLSRSTTPVGKDESGNVVQSYYGKKPEFDFKPKSHVGLGVNLDILDEKRAAKISGSRFVFLKNEAVLLEFALIQYVLGILTRKGFTPLLPPLLVKETAMYGTGFFPVEKTQYYKTELDDLFLIGTSEVPLCAYHSDEFLDADMLPLKYTAFSTCFRREAGTYGKDLGGMFRVHQFDKVEMFIFAHPEKSWEEYEKLRGILEEIMQGFKFHYRIVNMCTGDIGAPNAKKYDLEAWLPEQKRYRELASCSHDTDFQARRLNIKYRDGKKKELVHTMNSTACAVGRTLIAIYENYQDGDGNIKVPEVLQPYMDGIEIISRKKWDK